MRVCMPAWRRFMQNRRGNRAPFHARAET
jgi:hypothetical protein